MADNVLTHYERQAKERPNYSEHFLSQKSKLFKTLVSIMLTTRSMTLNLCFVMFLLWEVDDRVPTSCEILMLW
jgi:hypothetical protein